MSHDWVKDIRGMHGHYNVHDAAAEIFEDADKVRQLYEFRVKFLVEELTELKNAKDAEDVVDALIDLCVVAIGTLDIFNVNPYRAWDKVLEANMAKQPGVNPSRPNPLGLPDLIKPPGWKAPSHECNHGEFSMLFED